ncbi:MAG: FAD-dependent oxidoreductase, partial [Bacteroidota bacterium]
TGIPPTEIAAQSEEISQSRRRLITNLGKVAILTTIAPPLLFACGKTAPRIAIVGGGIAGLNALHTLKKAGMDATIYEASGRSGGRILTSQKVMGEGTWTEFGGEFIDTIHEDMHNLVKEFGLELVDLLAPSESELTSAAFFFNGQHYSMAQVAEAFQPFAARLKADIDLLPDDINYRTATPEVVRLDKLSITQYLDELSMSGLVKSLLESAYEAEYGLSPQVQSSINLLFLISPEIKEGQIELFGESDERYMVKGGNQQIPDLLAKKYPNHIELNRSLLRIRQSGSGFRLQFSGRKDEVKADFVILTLPFTKLREVEMDLELPEVKRRCIETIGYGMGAKMMMGLKTHHWRSLGYTGYAVSDTGIGAGYDNSYLQTPDSQAAGYSILLGGDAGRGLVEKSSQQLRDTYLPKMEQIFKGFTSQFSDKSAVMHWPTQPFTLGSYTCYTIGQYTSIAGAEVEPMGNLFFAGEHCGGYFSGFMNGAAMSGRQAAEAVLKRIGK